MLIETVEKNLESEGAPHKVTARGGSPWLAT